MPEKLIKSRRVYDLSIGYILFKRNMDFSSVNSGMYCPLGMKAQRIHDVGASITHIGNSILIMENSYSRGF